MNDKSTANYTCPVAVLTNLSRAGCTLVAQAGTYLICETTKVLVFGNARY